ncbi:MAG: hypothetical protein SWO11_09995 [Thermodesulfobacteriota bacterium]|nr:hypothetical protein [Thermodesulfobacteriota bacterium]
MEIEKRKLAAISTAIFTYLNEEGETNELKGTKAPVQISSNAWGLFGRQEMMRMRSLLQGRMLQR